MNDTKRYNLEMCARNLENTLGYTNELSFSLRNLLITLTTFLITFSSPIFTDIAELDDYLRIFLYLSWIFGVISLVGGLIGFFVDIKFFEDKAWLNKKIHNMFSNCGDSDEAVNSTSREVKKFTDTENIISSSSLPITVQIIFWGLQLIFLIIFLTGVLF